MEMKEMTVSELSQLTASDKPAPGGGSISALAGAFAAALAAMVARLTEGKSGYENAQEEMRALIDKADIVRKSLLDQIQRDADAFDDVMAAFALPKDTDEERTKRKAAVQAAMWAAAEAPYRTAEQAASLMPLAEIAVGKGNPSAVTDGLVAAILARAAVRGALLNVRINLESIDDAERAAVLREKCTALDVRVRKDEARVLALAPTLFYAEVK